MSGNSWLWFIFSPCTAPPHLSGLVVHSGSMFLQLSCALRRSRSVTAWLGFGSANWVSVWVGGWLCPRCTARGRGRGGNERTQTESLGGRIQGFRHDIQEKEKHEERTFLKDEILLGAEKRGVRRREGQTEEGEGWTERGHRGEQRDLLSLFQVSS